MGIIDPPSDDYTPGEPPRGGYATIDSLDPELPDRGDDWQLRMDVVDQDDWMRCDRSASADIIRANLRTYILETDASRARQLFGRVVGSTRDEAGETRRWWRLEFQDGRNNPHIHVYPNVFGEPFRLRVSHVDDVDPATSRELDRTCGMDNLRDATEQEIKDGLGLVTAETAGIGVLDVGQGSACALLDNGGVPLAYFDIGGGKNS